MRARGICAVFLICIVFSVGGCARKTIYSGLENGISRVLVRTLGIDVTDTGAVLRTLEDGYAYMIFDDANTESAKYGEELIEHGVAWSAASIEELAEKAGLPADALAATVAAYNAACAAGKDEQFGTPADFMKPIASSKVYAARIAPGSTASMPLSVYVDEDMTVTLTKNGQRIENLHAAGGACGNVTPVAGFGAHVYEALASGTFAGECVRVALTGK